MSTVPRTDAHYAVECRACRALFDTETVGDAEDLGEQLAVEGATRETAARHTNAILTGPTQRTCRECFRALEMVGSALRIETLRPDAPRLECARCATFIASCGGLIEPVRAHRRYLVKASADEPARSYGYGRLALDSLRCDRCMRALRVVADRDVRRVQIELFASDPAPTPERLEPSEIEARVSCARCRGFLHEVAPAGVSLADGHHTIAFSGGSAALLDAHFGPRQDDVADRTCPDCRRQTHLTTESDRPRHNGQGRLEIEPGVLGPFEDGCATCAPIVRETHVHDRRLYLGLNQTVVYVPRVVWDLVASRMRVGRSGDAARCDECGRDARLFPYGPLPVELGVHARPSAARSRRPSFDCARCQSFVDGAERAEVIEGWLALHLDPEPTYGPPRAHSPGRLSVTYFACGDCAREIRCEEDPAGWVTKVAIARPH